jgi:hypothetical protein
MVLELAGAGTGVTWAIIGRSGDSGKFRGGTVDVLDYEELVADFESRLVTQLRRHGANADYLETWVPDDDFAKSLLNMVEAASASGCGEIAVRVSSSTQPPGQIEKLKREIGALGTVSVEGHPDGVVIVVRGIKSS